jgi:hypothetical protein
MVDGNPIGDLKRALASIRLQIEALEASVPEECRDKELLRRIQKAKNLEQTLVTKIPDY